jgi:nicotinate-nucleotide pyrophosphorylase (carboxylating)
MQQIDRVLRAALEDDIGPGDITTAALMGPLVKCRAKLVAGEDGILAGVAACRRAIELTDHKVQVDVRAADGTLVGPGFVVARLYGPAASILKAERVAMNIVQHLSGIATLTARYVHAVRGTKVKILDTRRTTPGLRLLEGYAVQIGGGYSRRRGLYDRLLVREAHLVLLGGVAPAVRMVRRANVGKRVEVQISNMQELEEALNVKVDLVVLENFQPGQVRQAMLRIRNRTRVEASGKIPLENARSYALAGVDYIAVPLLTQNIRPMEFSLRVTK